MNHCIYKWVLAAAAAWILISCCGCSMDGGDNKDGVGTMLNQRQMEILEAKGLPTDYTKLTAQQQGAITAIERFLTYLETTHEDDFTYREYWLGGTEPEHMTATCSRGEVTAYRVYEDGTFRYWDTYDTLLKNQEVEADIRGYFRDLASERKGKLIVSTHSGSGTAANNGVVYGNLCVFLPDTPQEELRQVAQDYAEWLAGLQKSVQMDGVFYGVDMAIWEEIEDYNYQMIIDGLKEYSFVGCYVNENGLIHLYERGENQ